METQDKQNLKKKAFAISAIMKNPKLAQSIFDSWDSPVGSTKNTKAKSILYSMKRANNIHDGQGGIGDWWQSNVVSPLQGVGRGIKSGIEDVSGKIQEPPGAQQLAEEGDIGTTRFVRGIDEILRRQQPTFSPEQSRISALGTAGEAVLRYGPEAAGKVIEGAVKTTYPWIQAYGQAFATGEEKLLRGMYNIPFGKVGEPIIPREEDLYTKYPFGKEVQKKYYRVAGTDEVYDKASKTHITAAQAAKIPGFWNQVEEIPSVPTAERKVITVQGRKIYEDTGELVEKAEAPKTQEASDDFYKQMIQFGQDPAAAALEAKWQTGFQPDVDTINRELEKDPYYNPEFGKSTLDEMTPEETEAWFDSLDSSEQDFWRDSYEASSVLGLAESAYELGLGSKTFAWTLLQDKEKLAAALGIPKEQAASLPEGLLSEQLNDLRDTIDKKYKIESQLDKLFDLQQRDLTIEDDFKSYIRGKDEYLGDIDKLLDGAETKIANMDTSNPYVAQRMQMYVNYLTILQGRQNKRYIDFLDSGITKHKNDIDSATNIYNKSIEQANKEYQEIGTVTVESHNMLKTMLEDIYDNIESREDRQIKLEEYERWKIDAEEKSLNLVLQNAKLNAEVYGGTAGIEVNASTAKMFKDMYMVGENDDGTLNFSTYNPYEVQSSAATAGQNDIYAVNSFMKDMGYTVRKSTENGSLNQFEKFKESMIKNVASSVFDLNNLTKAEQEEYDKYSPEEKATLEEINSHNQEDLTTMYSKLETNLQSGLKEYFSSTEEKIKALREAIDDLGKKEGGWFGWGKVNREDFMKNHSSTLGDYAKVLFDYTEDTLKHYPGKKSNDIWGDIPDEFLSETVSRELAGYLML